MSGSVVLLHLAGAIALMLFATRMVRTGVERALWRRAALQAAHDDAQSLHGRASRHRAFRSPSRARQRSPCSSVPSPAPASSAAWPASFAVRGARSAQRWWSSS